MHNWIRTKDKLPPEHDIVMTKIDDEKGVRNEQKLIRISNLWFEVGGAMYVYYTPTHWHKI